MTNYFSANITIIHLQGKIIKKGCPFLEQSLFVTTQVPQKKNLKNLYYKKTYLPLCCG